MSFTLSNVNLVRTLNNLNNVNKQLNQSNLRLSTGLRINRAADDPTGIVAATQLEQEMVKITAQNTNAQRISSQIDTADGALGEISTLVNDIETSLIAASDSTASEEEKAAYQEQIDLAIDAIDRLVNTTTFNGQKLLDGSLGYTTSGVTSSELTDVRITSSTRTSSSPVSVETTAAATQATLTYSGTWLADDVTFTITGPDGSQTFSFAAGTGKGTIASAVAAASGTTGVTTEYPGGTPPVEFKTTEYGSDTSFTLEVTQGTFAFDEGSYTATGTDASVKVNGVDAGVNGNKVTFNANGINGSLYLTDSFSHSTGTSTFTLSGNGANWHLDASTSGRLNFGSHSVLSTKLGNSTLGYLSSLKTDGDNDIDSGNTTTADSIVSYASKMVARERARFGAMKTYAVDSRVNALEDSYTALSEAKSSIMDADYTSETALNNSLSTLLQVGAKIITSMNTTNSNVLTLLGLR